MLDDTAVARSMRARKDAFYLQKSILTRAVALRRAGKDRTPLFDDGIENHVFCSAVGEAEGAGAADVPALDVEGFRDFAVAHAAISHGQLLQDLWAAFELGGQTGGYFVEFGATNGMTFSNTIMLDRHFGWTGILAEPNPSYHAKLFAARSCHISTRCVHSVTGAQVEFLCASRPMLSRIADRKAETELAETGVDARVMVETISLGDLLDSHDAPGTIDYLSVDTEGSEYEILRGFDFSRRRIKLISVEHNHGPNEALLDELLTAQGYVRRAPALSRFDAWYRHRSTF